MLTKVNTLSERGNYTSKTIVLFKGIRQQGTKSAVQTYVTKCIQQYYSMNNNPVPKLTVYVDSFALWC